MPAARRPRSIRRRHPILVKLDLGSRAIIDAGGNIGCAVEPVLQMHRQCREVGIIAGEHDLVHRRLRGGHLDRSSRMPESLAQHGGKAGLVGFERGGKPSPRAHHVAHELGLLRSDRAEPHRAGIAIEHRGDVDEVDRIVVDDAFALLHELLDEMRASGTCRCRPRSWRYLPIGPRFILADRRVSDNRARLRLEPNPASRTGRSDDLRSRASASMSAARVVGQSHDEHLHCANVLPIRLKQHKWRCP